jgi:hypothetical protein
MTKISVSKTPQYELAVDKAKNRIYLKIIGFWRNPEQVSEYLNDLNRAIGLVSPPFTFLTDATEMKIHPGTVREIHAEAQNLITNNGVLKVAEIQADKVSEIQLESLSKSTKMPKMRFTDQVEAEKWLDE